MKNILVLFHQATVCSDINVVVCFYESLLKSLSKYNNVVAINTNFLKNYDEATITKLSKDNKCKFIEEVKKFNADCIFTFNNQITKEIIDNTNCPICLFDADSIDLFCKNTQIFIKQYQERYYMFSYSCGWEPKNRYLALGFKEENINFIHLATLVQKEIKQKTANISFIGHLFNYNGRYDNINARALYERVINSFNDNNLDYSQYIKEFSDKLSLEEIYGAFDTRVLVLNSLLDLGVHLYGKGFDMLNGGGGVLKIALIKEAKYSLQHNQDIYNSSKISISISHPQCRGIAFPWRIYDIMASNSLLISSYSKNLEDLTRNFVKIPMYKNPYDARTLCQYALNNPNYCEDIILASNEFIEKYGRWDDNFKLISEVIKVDLSSKKEPFSPFKIAHFSYGKNLSMLYNELRIILFSFISTKKVNKIKKKIEKQQKEELKCMEFTAFKDYE